MCCLGYLNDSNTVNNSTEGFVPCNLNSCHFISVKWAENKTVKQPQIIQTNLLVFVENEWNIFSRTSVTYVERRVSGMV